MKKVLFVTYDFPYPLTSGGKTRAFNLMKYAKDKNIELHLLSFTRDDYKEEWKLALEKIGLSSINVFKRRKVKSINTTLKNISSKDSIFKTLYYDSKFLGLMKSIIEKHNIQVVHFESSYTGFYIGDELSKLGVKQILGTENIEYLLYEDYLKNSNNYLKKIALHHQVNRFKKEETAMMRKADLCLAVTQEEADYIKGVSKDKCEIIENAISIEDLKFKVHKLDSNNILFVGNFTYMPNVNAISYFIKEVMPKFEKNITLTIIGKRINEFVTPNSQIIIKEFVKDLTIEYDRADALVFPIKIGGGTNFKILEAMALGTPVIGFPDKIMNIGAKPDKEFYSANTPEEFASQYLRIRRDGKEVERITKNARKLIEENYSWEKVGKKLNSIWSKINNDKN